MRPVGKQTGPLILMASSIRRMLWPLARLSLAATLSSTATVVVGRITLMRFFKEMRLFKDVISR
jgi:hypothetical protein